MIKRDVCCFERLIQLINSMREPRVQISYEPMYDAYFIKAKNNNGVVEYYYTLIEPSEKELRKLKEIK